MLDEEFIAGKSVGDLGREAMWYALHTVIAIVILAVVVTVMYFMRLDQESSGPKLIGVGLAFLIPLIGGFFIVDRAGRSLGLDAYLSRTRPLLETSLSPASRLFRLVS